MAKGRMLDKKISYSDKVAELTVFGQLLYERMILHSDDFGLLQTSARAIKAIVVPMIDTTAGEVASELTHMSKVGLIRNIKIEDREYLKIVNFGENQKFRRDINPQVIFPFTYKKSVADNWKECVRIVNEAITGRVNSETPRRRDVDVTLTKDKIREDKIIIVTNVTSNLLVAEKDPINEFICLFEKVNPNYERLFANKSQRASLERMSKKIGADKVKRAIEYAVQVNGNQYAPSITTPIQLEEKMGNLIAYLKSQEKAKPFVAVMPTEL